MESITELLNLEGYECGEVRAEGSWKVAELRYEARPAECAHCGSRRLHSHGWRTRRVAHAPMGEQLCDLEVRHQRWKCAECGRVQTPLLPGIGRRARLSDRLKGFINFLVFQLRVGMEAARRWLLHGWNTLWRHLAVPGMPSLESVRHLCLDEVFFCEPRRYLMVLSDAVRGVVLGVAEGRGYAPSSELLQRLPEDARAQVETLATDLNWGQRKAALEHLPNAEVAADCFHVVRLARKAVRESTAAQRPAALQAARELRGLLRGNSERALHDWIVRWKKIAGPLHTLVTTVSRWELEIAVYITTRRSTGPAEALNRKISLLRRNACGYTNKDNFIGMILSLNPPSHHKR